MYLEMGNFINVVDLWMVFYGLVGVDDGGDGEEWKVLVVFYCGMVELRVLGFVKFSKKKVDYVVKVKWL